MSVSNVNAYMLLDGDEDDNIDVLVSRALAKAEAEAKAKAEAEANDKAKKNNNDQMNKNTSHHGKNGSNNKNGVERSNRNGNGQTNGSRQPNNGPNVRANGSTQPKNGPNVRVNGSGQPNGHDNSANGRGTNFRSNNGYYQENGQKNGSRQANNGKVASANDRSDRRVDNGNTRGRSYGEKRVDNVANGNKQVPIYGNGSQRGQGYGGRRPVAKENHREGWETASRKGVPQRNRSLSIRSGERKEQSDKNRVEGAGEGDAATVKAPESKKSEPETIEKVLSKEEVLELAKREARWKVWLEEQSVMTLQEYEEEKKWENDTERKKQEAEKMKITLEELEVYEKKQKQKKKLKEEERLRKIWEDVDMRNERKRNLIAKDYNYKDDQAKSTGGDERRVERFNNGRNRDISNSGRGEGNNNASLKKPELKKAQRVPVPPSVTDLNHFPALGLASNAQASV